MFFCCQFKYTSVKYLCFSKGSSILLARNYYLFIANFLHQWYNILKVHKKEGILKRIWPAKGGHWEVPEK